MLKSNIALIGMMGCGKSSVAQILAKRLKRDVFSTDKMLEAKEGATIADIFMDKGEVYFRNLEKSVVKDVCGKQNAVIDCGGGVIIDPENRRLLKQSAVLFYLSASPEFLYSKIEGNRDRPLLQVSDPVGKLRDLLSRRKSFYKEADHEVVSEGRTVHEITDEIVKIIKI